MTEGKGGEEGEEGEEEEGGEDTHSRSLFSQFQTVIKSEIIRISVRGKRDPLRIVDSYSETHKTKQSG